MFPGLLPVRDQIVDVEPPPLLDEVARGSRLLTPSVEQERMEDVDEVRLAILNGFVTDASAGWSVNDPFCEARVVPGTSFN